MPRLRVPLLCCGFALLAAGVAVGQTPRPLTADESVELALRNHPRLQAARAEAAEAEAVRREAAAARLPALRAQGSYTRLGGEIPEATFTLPGVDTAITLMPLELNRYHAELGVEQPIFTGGRLAGLQRGAAHAAEAAARRLEQEEATVAFEVRRAFWALAAAKAARDALEGALARVDEHLRAVRTQVEAGAALPADLLTAQTRRSAVLLEQVEAENAVRVGELELNRLTGLPLDTPVEPAGEVAMQPLPDAEALLPAALAEHPAIAALERDVAALRAQLAAERGGWLPEVVAVGRYVYARPNPYALLEQDEFRGTWEAGVALQWSLWEGGRRPARTAQARARLQAAEARLLEGREQATVELARQRLELRRAVEALEVAALNAREAEETYRVVRQQFDEDVALPGQVLDAEQALRAAEARSARARADHAVAQAALLHAAGRVH